jgi:outer membrane lipoprotein SlyB
MTDQRSSGEKEWEVTTNTYIFTGVGAVILGGLAYASLGGVPNTIAAAVMRALAGGALGLFF